MAVLRGILFFVFFGGLVWLAVSQGAKEEGAASTALAAELPLPDESRPATTPVAEPPESAGPQAPRPDDGAYGAPDDPPGQESPTLEDDPYVIDLDEESPAASEPPAIAIRGFDEFEDGRGATDDVGAPDRTGGQEPAESQASDWLVMQPEPEVIDEGSPEYTATPVESVQPRDAGRASQLAPLAPRRSPSGEFANLVLHAAVSGDPQLLNEYMGGGAELSNSERNLVSAFWNAINGDVEQGRVHQKGIDVSEGVTTAQMEVLARALEGDAVRAVPASYGSRDPMALAMTMAMLHADAHGAIRAGRAREACEALSSLVQLELEAPWDADRARLSSWADLLNNWQDRHRLSPRGDWPAVDYEVQDGDHLTRIRAKVLEERPDLLVCTGLIERANDLGEEYLQPGQQLRIPTTAPNVVVDLGTRTLLYRHGDEVVRAWTVGIGRAGHETPTGAFLAGEKQPDPSWMPVGGRQLPFGHPDNPLGTRWIEWYRDGEGTSYGFHGTSDPSGVGGSVSQGCVRMHNGHVEELYDLLPIGASISVQP